MHRPPSTSPPAPPASTQRLFLSIEMPILRYYDVTILLLIRVCVRKEEVLEAVAESNSSGTMLSRREVSRAVWLPGAHNGRELPGKAFGGGATSREGVLFEPGSPVSLHLLQEGLQGRDRERAARVSEATYSPL